MKSSIYFSLAILLFFTLGCKKDNPAVVQYSYLTYTNSTFTEISFVSKGVTTVIQPNNTATFTGSPGEVFNYNATSYGHASDGTQFGLALQWSGPNNFPGVGATDEQEFKVADEDFFMYITNNSDSLTINKVVTNYNSSEELTDNLNIGPDKQQYNIGYYKLYSNTEIRAYYTTTHGTTGYAVLNNPVYAQDGAGNYFINFVVNN